MWRTNRGPSRARRVCVRGRDKTAPHPHRPTAFAFVREDRDARACSQFFQRQHIHIYNDVIHRVPRGRSRHRAPLKVRPIQSSLSTASLRSPDCCISINSPTACTLLPAAARLMCGTTVQRQCLPRQRLRLVSSCSMDAKVYRRRHEQQAVASAHDE